MLRGHAVGSGPELDDGDLRGPDQEDGHEGQVWEHVGGAEQERVRGQVRDDIKVLVRVHIRGCAFINIAKWLKVASILSEGHPMISPNSLRDPLLTPRNYPETSIVRGTSSVVGTDETAEVLAQCRERGYLLDLPVPAQFQVVQDGDQI